MPTLPSNETTLAWIALHRAQRLLLELVESDLKRNQLPSLEWYDVLLELNREKETGLRQYEIGERMLLNKHNLSRLLDRLEKQDLVRRYACEEDGRGNRIKLTPQGEAMLQQMWPVYGNAIQCYFGNKLSEIEQQALTNLLQKILVRG